ncbi:MAG TPA: alpha/beta hydrolase [Mesorhizobium sp.]|jgi:hypothetical protein|nr:alpha/beta hydrolase [Mesorhizobium sp.]
MRLFSCLLLLLLAFPPSAWAVELKPFKDELFAYPGVISTSDGGRYVTVDYSEARDIDARDEVPERRVRREYVSLGVRSQQRDLRPTGTAGGVRHVAVGRDKGASLILLYLHGQGGSRRQGVDDFTFGGNFNRVKNLVAGAGGLYLSPDFSDFGETGAAEIAALIDFYAGRSPGAPVVVACGSAGGGLCWELAKSPEAAAKLDGLLLLGSFWDEGFLGSPAFRSRVPVFFGHGSRDKVFPLEKQAGFFRSILKAAPDYPARFAAFEGGTHGTPIRMTDWRDALNWMLQAKP